jgi:ubiquitin C-terminal hydrolase
MLESLNTRTEAGRARHAKDLIEAVFGPNIAFSLVGQQDAHEFLQALITLVFEQAARVLHEVRPLGLRSLPFSVIPEHGDRVDAHSLVNPLKGLSVSDLVCCHCHSRSSRSLTAFDCLIVPIPRFEAQSCSLVECLSAYHGAEIIEGVNCTQCALFGAAQEAYDRKDMVRCAALAHRLNPTTRKTFDAINKFNEENAATQASNIHQEVNDSDIAVVPRRFAKRLSIARFPKTLCLQINRFDRYRKRSSFLSIYIHSMGHAAKSHCRVMFEEYLDAGVCLPCSSFLTPAPYECDEERSSLALNGKGFENRARYRLQAVVAHLGMANSVGPLQSTLLIIGRVIL